MQLIIIMSFQRIGVQNGNCELRRRTKFDLLRPLKVEIYNQNPRVEVFYDLLSTKTLKKLGRQSPPLIMTLLLL